MGLSRTVAVHCGLAPVAGPLHAQAASAEAAMLRYRALTSVTPKPCRSATDAETIVVCATRLRKTQTLPYPEELNAGRREALVMGEMPRFNVTPPCPPRGCPGGGSIIGAIGAALDRIRN